MDLSINTATSFKGGICRVDDGLGIYGEKIALYDFYNNWDAITVFNCSSLEYSSVCPSCGKPWPSD